MSTGEVVAGVLAILLLAPLLLCLSGWIALMIITYVFELDLVFSFFSWKAFWFGFLSPIFTASVSRS